jgi:hypothetical protein
MTGVATADPVTIAATALLLLGAGLATATSQPGQATQVDPMVMLRYQ